METVRYLTCFTLIGLAAHQIYKHHYPRIWIWLATITILNLLLMGNARGAYPECWPPPGQLDCTVYVPCVNCSPPGAMCFYEARCGNIAADGGPLCVYTPCSPTVTPPTITSYDKTTLHTTADAFQAYAAAMSLAALVVPAPAAKAGFGAAAVISGIVAVSLRKPDPFDPNYMFAFVPVINPIPDSVRGEVWKDLVRNEYKIDGYANALKVAGDRLTSAMWKQDAGAIALQKSEINKHLNKLSNLLWKEADLRVIAGNTVTLANNPLLNQTYLIQLRNASVALQ